MGQVLHGSARTTEAIRRAIQRSERERQGARRSLWDQPDDGEEAAQAGERHRCPMGPKAIHSTVLGAEEAIIVALRRHTLLPLDECLYALQPTIPQLTRSSLHRCLQRHGISRLPALERQAAEKKRFKATRSATSASTLPRCASKRGSCISTPASTIRRN